MKNLQRFCSCKRVLLSLLLFLTVASGLPASEGDLNFDGVFEVALDLPRILFLLKRDSNGPPLEYLGNFELNWAFLDTGASGILLSRETTDYMEISIHPEAQFADVGIGGIEFFDVSELLYIGTAGFNDPDPYDPNNYLLTGPWRFQVKQYYAGPWPDEPIDILGIPVMAGKTVVLDAGAPNRLEYFSADIKEPNDPAIPPVDFNVPLRFERYIVSENPDNIPPLPVLAYNPVIDNVIVEYDGNSAIGTWVLDTGATISLMSGFQAAELGLTDLYGTPIVEPNFLLPIGGIGGQVEIPGYQIDNLIIPTLNGYNLVFNNARIGVYNIIIIDETGEFIILDGVFGSNFLCASAKLLGGWPVDLAEGPFEKIVFDTHNALLGFDVNDIYPLPDDNPASPWPEGDLNRDWAVNLLDLQIIIDEWLNDCDWLNWNCRGADLNPDNIVNFADYAELNRHWQ